MPDDALGPARRSRRVEHRAARRRRRIGKRPSAPRRAPFPSQPCLRRGSTSPLAPTTRAPPDRGPGSSASSVSVGDQHLGPASRVGDELDLVGLEVPVDRAPLRAEVARGDHQLDRRGAVAHQQRDDVAVADAGRAQRRRRPQTAPEESVGGLGAAFEHDGRLHGFPGCATVTWCLILACDRPVVNSAHGHRSTIRHGTRLSRGIAAVVGMALLAGGAAATAAPVERLRVPPGFRIEVLTDAVPNARALALGRFEGDRGVVYVGSRAGAVYAVEIERGRTRAVHTDRVRLEPAGGRRLARRQPLRLRAVAHPALRRHRRAPRRSAAPGRRDRQPAGRDATTAGSTSPSVRTARSTSPVGAPCNVCVPDARHGLIAHERRRQRPRGRCDGVRNTRRLRLEPGRRDALVHRQRPRHARRRPAQRRAEPACRRRAAFRLSVLPPGRHARSGVRPAAACSEFVPPVARLGAHVAALGMRFYTGRSFPEAYRRSIFVAEHGSWNRSRKSATASSASPSMRAGGVESQEPFVERLAARSTRGARRSGAGRPTCWCCPTARC